MGWFRSVFPTHWAFADEETGNVRRDHLQVTTFPATGRLDRIWLAFSYYRKWACNWIAGLLAVWCAWKLKNEICHTYMLNSTTKNISLLCWHLTWRAKMPIVTRRGGSLATVSPSAPNLGESGAVISNTQSTPGLISSANFKIHNTAVLWMSRIRFLSLM